MNSTLATIIAAFVAWTVFIGLIAFGWGYGAGCPVTYDLDGSGKVDMVDVSIISSKVK